MRVLCATTANDGHFGPLQTVARAVERAGHQVRVAAPESYRSAVEGAGFVHASFADAPLELIGPIMGRLPTMSFAEADATVVREVFGRIDAQAALPGLTAIMSDWPPDLVLREPAELGSLAASVQAEIPHVQLSIGMMEMTQMMRGLVAEPLRELATLAGMPADALDEPAHAEPVLSSVPAELDRAGVDHGADDGGADAAVAFRFRDHLPDDHQPEVTPLPHWGEPDAPLVYVTFGSVTGSLPPFAGVFREAIDGLADQPVRVFMTVGRRVDISALGPLPPNTRVEPWWPQTDLLRQAQLVVNHGGFGTVMGAVRAGVPQVVAPVFTSDQVINGRHVAAAGAGRTVGPGPDIAEACRQVGAVLDDPVCRQHAQRLATASAELPAVSEAVELIERLAVR